MQPHIACASAFSTLVLASFRTPTADQQRTASMGNLQHPQVGALLVVDFPAPKVLLLRLNRPEALNAMTADLEADLAKVRVDLACGEVGETG